MLGNEVKQLTTAQKPSVFLISSAVLSCIARFPITFFTLLCSSLEASQFFQGKFLSLCILHNYYAYW